ncbi:hypothetical protein A2686_02670 [Candidatus Woesebacteria bacterium RIFCSPHIGHO2_01_FULL_38_10]|uniref:Pseudouridine synthase n=1 Tax=Candidatus Woesebacteria bacterium RIFCSPLOWO2_01_FULL_39_10b TaxID=1802517 RepID=A0A1F8B958_9BACT|nr:MAG: hypothetical protein A2686_02670 [Candidatus Woesebacteria bacterium RIFCSPHIGHO2_01_FULL_38_10]OGM60470.1 MAG: hypothetical protein A2892_00365 [Candidatus Woesebacteria bacterium RIFCSPLOWO2_01_FULL_39_10b]
MEPEIIFEDESLLILSKPSGWIVNEAKTTLGRLVVQGWIAKNFQYPISKNKLFRNGIVHRLDKETSGILLLAKTSDVFHNLQNQFKNREVEKTYIALVHGKLVPEEGIVSVPTGRLPWNKERFGIVPGGKESQTFYKVKKYLKKDGEDFSLVEFYPKTGRTHQIRVHSKYLGHPIVSDQFYAGRKTSRSDRKWCPRLFLHANKIKFRHPNKKKMLEFNLELPYDLQNCLDNLMKGVIKGSVKLV